MEIERAYGQATTIVQPMLDVASPESNLSGATVADESYYNDGAGWVSTSFIDSFTEIGTTGEYSIDLTTAEMQHSMLMIKMTAAGAADNTVVIYTGQDNSYYHVRNMVVEQEGNITFQQAMSVILAVTAGVTTGGGLIFQDPSGTSIRVQSTVDNDSNRLTITLTPST